MTATGMTTLDVRELAQGLSAQYTYELRSGERGGDGGTRETEYNVDVSPALVSDWCAQMDALLTSAAGGPGAGDDPVERLRELGALLYDHLFPRVGGILPDLVRRLRESIGPLLVRTNEPAQAVPWELLHDGRDFLGLKHDLGRRSVGKQQVVGGRTIDRLRRALIVGDTLGDLDAAREEVARVADWLRGRGVECTVVRGADATVSSVVRELASDRRPYDLFHYCGHVASSGGVAGLLMHRRELLDQVALQTLSTRGAPPVVFINGCASAGRVASMCRAFTIMGAKTVIGTRAEVADDGAWRFAELFYDRLLGGEPAGAAVRGARAGLRERPDAAWASFVLYGDPTAYLTGDAPPDPAPEEPPGSTRHALTPDALMLLTQIRANAVPRGVVTSVDLLLGLLGLPELRERVTERIGTDRFAVLVEVVGSVLDRGGDGELSPDEVQLSDTVTRVLLEAESVAVAGGRSAIGTADIAAAFVTVGGGISAQLLELCGLSLDQLLPEPAAEPAAAEPEANAEPDGGERMADVVPLPRAAADANGDGRVRTDGLGAGTAAALRLARLLAELKGEIIGSHTLLLAFGALGNETLRRGLAAQGPAGEAAFEKLARLLVPRSRDVSPRVNGVLERAPDGDAAVLAALLADRGSAARGLLRDLGVDPDRLAEALAAPD